MDEHPFLTARLQQLAPHLSAPAWILIFVGIAAMFSGWRWELFWLVSSGIIIIGSGLILLGVETLYSPELPSNRFPGGADEQGRSFSTTLGAFWFVFIGVVMASFGLVLLVGAGDALILFFQKRPGIPILITALSLVTYGLPSIVGVRRGPASALMLVASLPARLLGLLAVLFGVAAFALGVFELIDPSGFDSLFGV